jgi:hypothetical protein
MKKEMLEIINQVNKNYKPRDPARIPKLLLKLCALWEMYPDMRLGQLIENIIIHHHSNHVGICGVESDLWNWQDEQWSEAIQKMGEKK